MKKKILIGWIGTLVTLLFVAYKTPKQPIAKKEEVKDIIIKVNDYWQANHKAEIRSFWDHAAYHTGNIAAYKVTKKEAYFHYSLAWAKHNEWKGAKSNNKSEWKYKYGETDEYVLFGDWQICFQTYIDLYQLSDDKSEQMIARAKEVMEYEMSTSKIDYWWWADGLYMVMPVMTKLYQLTGDERYLDKLYEYFSYSKDIMYDKETGLFFRDARYVFPKHTSENGKKDFWARGDGWVFAGLAKVLQDTPKSWKKRAYFEDIYKKMAITLKEAQQKEGYWTRSILDPEHAPGPETSGTAFFTYGYLWGINNGVLSKKKYLPVIQNSWHYLITTALNENGKIGYVQPIGERAIPGQQVDENSTADFGVGAYLLAACEMYQLVSQQ
ncbi:glycoside hydrolase family 88/105 protein [Flammeovirga pacifica]|uniref:Family 88 glycosyl hydrolase n=1 Tax=Flammeovirga pacifica TaxID=915059 RepID=A0A1S1YTT2_FLAPC|nr:glycoside hydrolase family 88 protein [Flammeovirga pacifica]OHX64444.1 family 88 glycosyl hydrolase [Flammeovirga pacifica]